GNGWGADVTTDFAGNVYTTGNYVGTVDFGPGPGVTSFTNLYDDAILAKFNSNGVLMYAAPFTRTPDGYSLCRRIVPDA
ncbi:hypothetical protein, partial [Rhizobium leguminosarum]|uniref:hypothetical protein n=1 Tax=Rhizobium leguminosarum TaxID=384 RepID=UPI003F9945E7